MKARGMKQWGGLDPKQKQINKRAHTIQTAKTQPSKGIGAQWLKRK